VEPWKIVDFRTGVQMDSLSARRRLELSEVVRQHIDILSRLGEGAADAGTNSRELSALHDLSMRLAAQETRLLARLRQGERQGLVYPAGVLRSLVGERALREDVLDVLDVVGVPAAPRLVSEVAAATLDRAIPAERMASLRRDEREAYRRKPGARPQWVIPALNVLNLGAMPRLLASSAWEAPRRLVGVRTARVNHLKTLLSLVDRIERGQVSDAGRAKLEALVRRFAESVPNAVAHDEDVNVWRVREAAEDELGLIEPADRQEREQAARLLAKLPPFEQLWGRSPEALEAEQAAGIRKALG
jgi:alkylated DNA nucleotide flippase Atl1